MEKDEDRGQIFVRPTAPDSTKPINLFVSSEQSTVALLLQPVDTPSDTIVIREARAPAVSRVERSGRHVRTLKNLLLAMATDALPDDLEVREPGVELALRPGVRMTLQRAWLGAAIVGEKYLLANLGSAPLELAERDLFKPGVLAVSLEQASSRPVPRPTSSSSGSGAPMTESLAPDAATVKRRQYLLLAGVAGVIVVAAALSVFLTGTREAGERPARPKSINILAPGSQVDPRDAWRGQADAQLRAIEQKARELAQRNTEFEGRSKEMLQRLEKLEASGLTPLPPPPVPAPPIRPNFGPDRPGTDAADGGPQRLPPPPPPRALNSSTLAAQAPPAALPPNPPAPSGIVSVALGEGSAAKAAKPAADGAKATATRDARRYLPSGAFTRALLLGGLDAPTGGQAQRNPQPVLLRLVDHAVLPNHFRARVKECFVVGAGYGDVSAERAYVRTESLSCVSRDGTALDVPLKGYVAGEDGKAGLRGRLVSKQGQLLANALLAGVASGIGHAFQQGATTLSVSPLGATGTVAPGKQFEAGLGTGVGRALDRLAQYYISLAEKVFPVIEVDAGRTVDVVVTQGIALPGPLDEATADGEEFPQLAARERPPRSNDDDDD